MTALSDYEDARAVLRSTADRLRGYFDGETIRAGQWTAEAYTAVAGIGLGMPTDEIDAVLIGDRWAGWVHRLVGLHYECLSPTGPRARDFRVVVREAAEVCDWLADMLTLPEPVVPS